MVLGRRKFSAPRDRFRSPLPSQRDTGAYAHKGESSVVVIVVLVVVIASPSAVSTISGHRFRPPPKRIVENDADMRVTHYVGKLSTFE
eukprot:5353604-Pyramimonas_sp.AAC.1